MTENRKKCMNKSVRRTKRRFGINSSFSLGCTGVSLKTLKNICTVLGCSADTLLGIGVNDSGDAERFALKCSIDTLSDQTVLIARKILPEIESTVRDK